MRFTLRAPHFLPCSVALVVSPSPFIFLLSPRQLSFLNVKAILQTPVFSSPLQSMWTGTSLPPLHLWSQQEGPGPRCASLYQKSCMPCQTWLLSKRKVHADEDSDSLRIIHHKNCGVPTKQGIFRSHFSGWFCWRCQPNWIRLGEICYRDRCTRHAWTLVYSLRLCQSRTNTGKVESFPFKRQSIVGLLKAVRTTAMHEITPNMRTFRCPNEEIFGERRNPTKKPIASWLYNN